MHSTHYPPYKTNDPDLWNCKADNECIALHEDCPASAGVDEEDVDTDVETAKVFPGGNVEYPKALN